MVKLECPRCAKRFSIQDDLAGRRTKCSKCGTPFRIPFTEASLGSSAVSVAVIPVRNDAPKPASPIVDFEFEQPQSPTTLCKSTGRLRFLLIGISVGLTGGIFLGSFGSSILGRMGQLTSILSTSRMTKEQFRSKFDALKGGYRYGGVVDENDLIQAMGKPSRTQTLGNDTYWYWQCQDGTIQIVILHYKNLAYYGEGEIMVTHINDY